MNFLGFRELKQAVLSLPFRKLNYPRVLVLVLDNMSTHPKRKSFLKVTEHLENNASNDLFFC